MYPFLRSLYRDVVQLNTVVLLSAIRGNYWAKKLVIMLCYLNLRLNVKDAEKKDKFMPRYPVGAKRTLFSNDFYPAIDQPNVQINTVGIKGIYDKGIINSDNSSTEVDTIIYATGFISNPFLYDMTVIGRSSKELWKEDKGAHAMFRGGECLPQLYTGQPPLKSFPINHNLHFLNIYT